VRVTSNKYPALGATGVLERRETGPLFREMDGVGVHEVIIEMPAHDRSMPVMTDHEVTDVLRAYQTRFRALNQDPRLKYIIIFKNHAKRSGCRSRIHIRNWSQCRSRREHVRKNFLLPRWFAMSCNWSSNWSLIFDDGPETVA
jgi:hypothetical protein